MEARRSYEEGESVAKVILKIEVRPTVIGKLKSYGAAKAQIMLPSLDPLERISSEQVLTSRGNPL